MTAPRARRNEVRMEPEHKRRVRYAGTHPRRFEEKYKELDPEKYQDEDRSRCDAE